MAANQFRRSNQQGQFQSGSSRSAVSELVAAGKPRRPKDRQLARRQVAGLARTSNNWVQVFGGNQQPFSSQWYNDHPKAWKYDNNKANIWIGGTLPGVYSWLGWGNVPQQYRGYYGNGATVQSCALRRVVSARRVLADGRPRRPGHADRATGGRPARPHRRQLLRHDHQLELQPLRRHPPAVAARELVAQQEPIRPLPRARCSNCCSPTARVTVQLPGGEQQWQFVRLEN